MKIVAEYKELYTKQLIKVLILSQFDYDREENSEVIFSKNI